MASEKKSEKVIDCENLSEKEFRHLDEESCKHCGGHYINGECLICGLKKGEHIKKYKGP